MSLLPCTLWSHLARALTGTPHAADQPTSKRLCMLHLAADAFLAPPLR